MLHKGKTMARMLEIAADGLDPNDTITINIHPKDKNAFKRVCNALMEAGYSFNDQFMEGKWFCRNFSMPGHPREYSNITIFVR